MQKLSVYDQLTAEVSFCRYDKELNEIFVCIDVFERKDDDFTEEIIKLTKSLGEI